MAVRMTCMGRSPCNRAVTSHAWVLPGHGFPAQDLRDSTCLPGQPLGHDHGLTDGTAVRDRALPGMVAAARVRPRRGRRSCGSGNPQRYASAAAHRPGPGQGNPRQKERRGRRHARAMTAWGGRNLRRGRTGGRLIPVPASPRRRIRQRIAYVQHRGHRSSTRPEPSGSRDDVARSPDKRLLRVSPRVFR